MLVALVVPAWQTTGLAAAPKRPDLVVTKVTPPAGPLVIGSTVELKGATRNVGRRSASRSQIGFLLSDDRRRGGGDVLLGGVARVGSLRPRRSSERSARVTIPATVRAGSFFLLACTDIRRRLGELSERNNCRASARRVELREPQGPPAPPADPGQQAQPGAPSPSAPSDAQTPAPDPPPAPAPPPAPGSPNVGVVSATTIDLAWQAVAGATGYRVLRATSAAGPYVEVAAPAGTSHPDTGLTPDTTYHYAVRAVGSGGESPNSASVAATTAPAPPPTPGPLSATTVSDTSIGLAWPAVAGATSYRVLRSTSAAGPYAEVAAPAGTSHQDTGLTPDTTYHYKVRAVGPGGASPDSAAVASTTDFTCNDHTDEGSANALNLGSISGDTGASQLQDQHEICRGDAEWARFELTEDDVGVTAKYLSATIQLVMNPAPPGRSGDLDLCVFRAVDPNNPLGCSQLAGTATETFSVRHNDVAFVDDTRSYLVRIRGFGANAINRYELTVTGNTVVNAPTD